MSIAIVVVLEYNSGAADASYGTDVAARRRKKCISTSGRFGEFSERP